MKLLAMMASLTLCGLFYLCPAAADEPQNSVAAIPPVVDFEPGPDRSDAVRMWQGISGLERTSGGRLWATWYGGGVTEDRHNYILMVTSNDDGKSWSDLKFVIDPDGDGPVRAFDPLPWIDPDGKLWLFWCQATKGGGGDPFTFAITTDNPDDENPTWSEPRLIHDGVLMCKPTVLSNGTWLLPTAIWNREGSCRVVASEDAGKTWKLRGTANVPVPKDRNCDEPMLVEREDKSVWLIVRTSYGIGESVSADGGRTWPDVTPWNVPHTASRFFIRRLNSGNLLLVKHGAIGEKTGRSHLTAFLSKDDGQSWQGGLLLDERGGVSYPDGAESKDGVIYLTYDYDRSGQKSIYMTTFTEADILAQRDVSGKVRQRVVINQATGINPRLNAKPDLSQIQFRANTDGKELLSGERAKLDTGTNEIVPLKKGAIVFTDRTYRLHQFPDVFQGKHFVRGSINGNDIQVQQDGLVFVATPATDRNKDNAVKELLKQGFTKANVPEFLLFGESNAPGNVCTIYQKKVKTGESITLGKWGVVIY